MAMTDEAQAQQTGQIVPTGLWVMDEARSRKLVPAALTLWVIRDDGKQLTWVSVETEPSGKITVNSFDGAYDGTTAVVQGNGMEVSMTSPGPRTVRVTGIVPGMGPFEEQTEISADRRHMVVNGKVMIGDEETTWYEEFNWHAASPHSPESD
jgi:hypothetical protein